MGKVWLALVTLDDCCDSPCTELTPGQAWILPELGHRQRREALEHSVP